MRFIPKAFLAAVLMGVFLLPSMVPVAAASDADIAKHPECPFCGMDRAKFSFSRIFVEYDDGSTFGACSLHCAAVDMAINLDKGPVSISVGDYNGKQLINAEEAFWVLGGDKPGVMTHRAKWAFADKAAAEAYIKEHGGELAGFEDALKASYVDMYDDTLMIRKKRAMKRAKMKKQ